MTGFTRLWLALGVLTGLWLGTAANAQVQTTEERYKELTDLDELTKKLDREKKNRPPFEFFRSQVAPFDVLPFIKSNHWNTLTLELRSNPVNYEGILQSASEVNGRPQIPLFQMSHAMLYRRDALLPKEQSVARSLQLMMPIVPKQLIFELTRPGAIRPDVGWEAIVQRMEPHQMLIPVLSPDPSVYNSWSKMQSTIPTSGDRDLNSLEKQRYYRLVLPQDPERVNLSPHPLTWTTTSHLVWDGFSTEALSRGPLSQQQAILDWIHFGGQLIVVAAGPNVASLQESFLGPYLPATMSGGGASLSAAELAGLSQAYRPPLWPAEYEEPLSYIQQQRAVRAPAPPRYKPAEPIRPTEKRPLFVAGLEPKNEPGISTIPLLDPGNHLLAVERRVGRGRIVMLAVNPNDPALAAWPGMDTLIRRVLLRRPEEIWGGSERKVYQLLSGPELSWVRLLGRDLGARPVETDSDPNATYLPGDLVPSTAPVAAWLDTGSDLPLATRDTFEDASGITIPAADFVLKVVVAYVIALVPLNWLICRFVLRRRELAWAIVPLLSLGFAYAVERAAAYDMGFDSNCDEIDLIEIQGGYPRAHLNRFAAIYSTGRVRYTISYPDDPSALALPMRAQQEMRGGEFVYSVFESSPVPALTEFPVEPRSLSMFRSEAMVDLGGGSELVGGFDGGKIVNGTDLELHDAVLIDVDSGRTRLLGNIGAWPKTPEQQAAASHEVALTGSSEPSTTTIPKPSNPSVDWADLDTYLKGLRDYRWNRPEEKGEVRLVAWTENPHPGQTIEPTVDRHRGFRMVVAHLRFGLPDPSRWPYYNPADPPPPED